MGVYAVTTTDAPPDRASWRVQGFLIALAAAGLCALGAFWQSPGTGRTDGWADYWPALIFICVVALLTSGLVLRTTDAMNASDRALGLTVLGAITLPAYWTGVPAVLVLSGLVALARARRPLTVQDGVTCFLAGAAMTGVVWLAFTG